MASEQTRTARSKTSYWQGHINGWRDSGLSQARYCRQHMLALSTFSYWKKKLSDGPKNSPHFYPLTVPTKNEVKEENRESGLRLVVCLGRFEIGVAKDFSPTTLMQLVNILDGIDADGVEL